MGLSESIASNHVYMILIHLKAQTGQCDVSTKRTVMLLIHSSTVILVPTGTSSFILG